MLVSLSVHSVERNMPRPSFLRSTAEAFWGYKWINAPFLVANLVLIGLISYGLIKTNELSEDEKKNLSYAEIAVSFVGSSAALLGYCFLILMGVSTIWISFPGTHMYVSIQRVIILLVLSCLLLLTPFTITVLRVGLNTTLSAQQKDILAGITIPSALWSIWVTIFVIALFNSDM